MWWRPSPSLPSLLQSKTDMQSLVRVCVRACVCVHAQWVGGVRLAAMFYVNTLVTLHSALLCAAADGAGQRSVLSAVMAGEPVSDPNLFNCMCEGKTTTCRYGLHVNYFCINHFSMC